MSALSEEIDAAMLVANAAARIFIRGHEISHATLLMSLEDRLFHAELRGDRELADCLIRAISQLRSNTGYS
ncbi:hypothetical protein [uncultured Enterobacter sp.]|uniref:hypothetical protein n=1 Tax=uncultured Enterobacter sp. TaxID=238202 RepID=UPI0025ED15C0|nr:hypothetical protein [uncultured Enterobacter sp.]